jgi:lipid-A-disaccharide synthase-like uncharacterized protein
MTSALLAELLNPWVVFGFFGQFVFFMRFILQWITSEKKHQVVVPMSFWWLSIGGSILILIYSIHIKDIVFATAQVASLFIYVRNMMLQNSFTKNQLATAKLKETP